ncbi:MAG: prepilin-type N-terminal cleavage/methylation domain-containing protein [Pirellulaceae bacterium]
MTPLAPQRVRALRTGFTLLELMLALALTAVVLGLINMAVEIQLRSIDARRQQVETSQLARSLLRIMANDIRATVQAYEQDMSSVEELIKQAQTAASGSSGQGGSSGGGSSGSASGGSTGSGNSSSGTSSGGTSTDRSSSSSSMGTGSASGSGSSTSSGSSGGASSSGMSSRSSSATGASSGTSTEGESGETATDLSAVDVAELPGLYGNQYQLQIDVSRLPRIDQYQQVVGAETVTEIADIPSDVKSVTYYVKTPMALSPDAAIGSVGTVEALTDPNANATGLVRRELDRAVTTAALLNGNTTGLENSGELLAPEVVGVEFRYFDGVEWRLEWDTTVEQMLPLAVQILLAVTTTANDPAAMSTTDGAAVDSSLTDPAALPANVRIYSMVVNLPTGGQTAGSTSASSSSTSPSSTSSSTTSSSSL